MYMNTREKNLGITTVLYKLPSRKKAVA